MQAGVSNFLEADKFQHIRSMEEHRYARDMLTVRLVNIETGKTDYVPKTKVREFWDNLADDDKQEMASWTYEAFLERLNTTYTYYIKREEKVIAIGGTYPDYPYICLWLLVSKDIGKYPSVLIKAVRKVIKKELGVYPIAMYTVLALPHHQAKTHHKFLEKVLRMNFTGEYSDDKKIYMAEKRELLECANQFQ